MAVIRDETEDELWPGAQPAETLDAPAPERNRQQFGALPYRFGPEGQLEVMLITSRTTRRWIIPKGWPMGERPPHKVAAREAEEEAGVEGRIGKTPIGTYHYDKLLSNGTTARCSVDVFALEVRKQKSAWPERKRRERRWMGTAEAAATVGDSELAPLIRAFQPVSPDEAAPAAEAGLAGPMPPR